MAQTKLEILLELKDRASRGMKQAGGNLEKFSATALKVGAALTAMAAAAAFAGFKLVLLASDAEETANKFDATFGVAAAAAREELNEFAQTVGRGRNELQRMAADSGAVLKSLGFTEQVAADLSVSMTKLATDVASFTNANDADVIRSFTRALSGERESLKTYGIAISEANVKAKAYELGIAKQGEELTFQMKALATYNLLLEKTTDSQDDAEKTAGGFANQQRRLKGIMEDLGVSIGNAFLPAATALLKIMTSVAAVFDSIPQPIKTLVSWITALVALFVGVLGVVALVIGIAPKLVSAFVAIVKVVKGAIVVFSFLQSLLAPGFGIANVLKAAAVAAVAGAAIAGSIAAVKGMQDFDRGGVVDGPIGKPRLVIAHGGERFLGARGTGGGISGSEIHLHVGAMMGTEREAREFVEMIAPLLRERTRLAR